MANKLAIRDGEGRQFWIPYSGRGVCRWWYCRMDTLPKSDPNTVIIIIIIMVRTVAWLKGRVGLILAG